MPPCPELSILVHEDLRGKNTSRYQASRLPEAQGLQEGRFAVAKGRDRPDADFSLVVVAGVVGPPRSDRPWGREPLGHCAPLEHP